MEDDPYLEMIDEQWDNIIAMHRTGVFVRSWLRLGLSRKLGLPSLVPH